MTSEDNTERINTMTTLSEVTTILDQRGYTVNLNQKEEYLECVANHTKLYHGDFTVDKHYRFEGISNPDDEAIVYAISSSKHNLKGVLIGGYGISSENCSSELLKALKETYR